MPSVAVFDMTRNQTGEIVLSDDVFGAECRSHLYHEVVRAQLLSRRQGTVQTKTRKEVSGSTRKVFRQKGTGRSRKGSNKSPLYRRGGSVFGPHPRDWEIRVPRKVRRQALVSALSDRVREGRVVILESLDLAEKRTRVVAEFLKRFDLTSALIVDTDNENLSLSCRNLPTVKYLSNKGLNLFDVLKYDSLVLTRSAVEAIEGALKP